MIKSVYIAAPWICKEQARDAKEKFEKDGFQVTAHWIDYHSDAELGDPTKDEELQRQAVEDLRDLAAADLFVILNLDKSEGKATELGVAYTLGTPCIVVGERKRNIFYYLPGVLRADSVEDVIEGIKIVNAREVEAALQPLVKES